MIKNGAQEAIERPFSSFIVIENSYPAITTNLDDFHQQRTNNIGSIQRFHPAIVHPPRATTRPRKGGVIPSDRTAAVHGSGFLALRKIISPQQ